MRDASLRTVAVAVLWTALLGASGCTSSAGGLSFSRTTPRERAIADCVARVPAQAPLYADAFSACMESHGWVHATYAD